MESLHSSCHWAQNKNTQKKKKKKSRIWLPVTVKSLLIVPIKYLFKFHMNSTAKPQTACNPLTSLLRLPLQADLQPARPRYARSIFFCQWCLLSSVPAVGAVTLQGWTHFAPKQRKQNSVFIIQVRVSGFQPIFFFFFFTMWPHPKEKNHTHKSSDFDIFCCMHRKKHSQSQTNNIPANTPPRDAKLFKIGHKSMCLFFS